MMAFTREATGKRELKAQSVVRDLLRIVSASLRPGSALALGKRSEGR